MAKKTRAMLPRAVVAALAKKESVRTVTEWRTIAKHFWKMVKIAAAEMNAFRTLAVKAVAQAEAAVSDTEQCLAVVREYDELLVEAIHHLRNHPAAAKLRSKAEALSKAQSLRARKPRARTKELRQETPHFLRENLLAYVREHGTVRNFFKDQAKRLRVTTKKLRDHMKEGMSSEQWRDYQGTLRLEIERCREKQKRESPRLS